MRKLVIPECLKTLHTPVFFGYVQKERFDVDWKETDGRSNEEKINIILEANNLLDSIGAIACDDDYFFGNACVKWECLIHKKQNTKILKPSCR